MFAMLIVVIVFLVVKVIGYGALSWMQYLSEVLLRCLSGLIVLYVCNFFMCYLNENLIVNINEISLTISAFFRVGRGVPFILFSLDFTNSLDIDLAYLHKNCTS